MIRLVAFELVGTVLDRYGKGATCSIKNAMSSIYKSHISYDKIASEIIYSKYHIPNTNVNEDFRHALKYLREHQIKDAGVSDIGNIPFDSIRFRLFETGNALCLYGKLEDVIADSYYNPEEIVKVGGTVEDLKEAKKKGLWTIGVVSTSPIMISPKILTKVQHFGDDLQLMKKLKIDAVREELGSAEPDSIIYDLTDLEIALGYINGKIIAKNK